MKKFFSSTITYCIIAIIISIISLIYACRSDRRSFMLAYQHIDPKINYYLELSNFNEAKLIIANEGDLSIVSFSSSNIFYVFNKNNRKVTFWMRGAKQYSPTPIFIDLFNPRDTLNVDLVSSSLNDSTIYIYEFKAKYYRRSDMKQYEDINYFFVDKSMIETHSEFIDNDLYDDIMIEINKVVFVEWEEDQHKRFIYIEKASKESRF